MWNPKTVQGPAWTVGLAAVTLAFVTGCGGGSSDDGGSSNGNEQDDAREPASAEGIWRGTFTEEGVGTFDAQGLLYDGRVIAISEGGGVIYDGEYSVTGDSVEASVRAYQINGWYFADADLQGTVKPSESMDLEFETTLDTEGSVSLEYDAQYDQPSDTSMIEGMWRYGEPGYEAIVDVEASGDFFAQDTHGCTYLGEARSLNPDKNLYSVDMSVSSCGDFDGAYTGFAALLDEPSMGEILQIVVSNPNAIVFRPLQPVE
ncbi:hypothetical protein [Thioalkalivibrio sp. ALE9]|uniref:hypothetical protein n=1 Tax=Thioalkalivibrio sp. ALE9 TaxID=1158169 RepID=UPI000370E4E8|nr:hypothetical protein [Thioalkalivibrio sp. ALE9]